MKSKIAILLFIFIYTIKPSFLFAIDDIGSINLASIPMNLSTLPGCVEYYYFNSLIDTIKAPDSPFNCGTSTVTFNYNGSTVTYGTVVGANNRCWLDRNLGATQVASSSEEATSNSHLFQWGRPDDGHQVSTSPTTTTLSNSDMPSHGKFITVDEYPFDWRSPQNNKLWYGEGGTNNPCPDGFRLPTLAEWDTERLSWSANNAAGAFASRLKLPMAGFRYRFNGMVEYESPIGFYWSSSIDSCFSGRLHFYSGEAEVNYVSRAIGMSVRCIKDENMISSFGSINCESAFRTGTLREGIEAYRVSVTVPYSAGNGGSYVGQTVVSTGVTGLTAYLYPGVFNVGEGTLNYIITGTPNGYGKASFALNIGGQSCNLQIPVNIDCGTSTTFSYNGSEVTYGIVQGANNRCWLDRNLGATQAATSSTDTASYGDLFQWGRQDDGHQLRTSPTSNTLSNYDVPGNNNFIKAPNHPYDWRTSQNNNLWQREGGTNNPCPDGYRLPTREEWDAERISWSTNDDAGAFNSILKLPTAGLRNLIDGSVDVDGSYGFYWSSTISNDNPWVIGIDNADASLECTNFAFGFSVRCIKNK